MPFELALMSFSGLLAAALPFAAAKAGKMHWAAVLACAELIASIVIASQRAFDGPLFWFFVPFWSGLVVAVAAILLFGSPSSSLKAEAE